jgi:hypothetical protein
MRDTGWHFRAPLDGATAGQLEIRGGAAHLDVDGDPAMNDLCRARFAGIEPEVDVFRGRMLVNWRFGVMDWLEGLFFGRWPAAQIVLNGGIPWEVQLRGGMSHVDADFSAIQLRSVETRGGASHVVLTLGQPAGVVPIRIRGGVSKVTICRPEGTAARLFVRGGASHLVLDDQRFGAMSGPIQLAANGGDAAPDRYEIEVRGGASKLAVVTWPEADLAQAS